MENNVEYIRKIADCNFYDGDDSVLRDKHKRRIASCLDKALDIRKFEIEMYWKRAQYFWTFISVVYGGYFIALAKYGEGERWITFLISAIGLIFSVGWYLVNKASKFWQNNWERHVDYLENIIHGPLYKTILYQSGNLFCPTEAYPLSVSKINQKISGFIALIALGLFIEEYFQVFWFFKKSLDVSIYFIGNYLSYYDWGLYIFCIGLIIISLSLGEYLLSDPKRKHSKFKNSDIPMVIGTYLFLKIVYDISKVDINLDVFFDFVKVGAIFSSQLLAVTAVFLFVILCLSHLIFQTTSNMGHGFISKVRIENTGSEEHKLHWR